MNARGPEAAQDTRGGGPGFFEQRIYTMRMAFLCTRWRHIFGPLVQPLNGGRRLLRWLASALSLFIITPVLAAPTPSREATGESAKTGEQIYNNVCAMCHEAGVPKAPEKGMLGFMSTGAIFHALTDGVMAERVPQLSLADKQAVAEYLTGIPLGEAVSNDFPMCANGASEFDVDQPPRVSGWGVTPDNKRQFTTETAGIDRDNVGRLKLKWVLGFPGAVRARSHPVTAAGAVFVGSQDGRVYALDRRTGCVRWIYRARAEVRTAVILSPWQAGDEDARPALYFGDYLGNVYSVDARSGELNWQLRPDSHPNATITGSPSLHNGVLYVPVSSLEVLSAVEPTYECCTFRGSVVALDAATGERRWQTYTIASEPIVQGKNGVGRDRYGPSGAPIWNSPAIDTARNQLLVGTGENYSRPTTTTSDAIIAMDLDSGTVNWVFQATEDDAWNSSCEVDNQANCPEKVGPDYDFGAPPLVMSASDGRDYVVAGQKSGIVWALDPGTGKLRWKQQVSQGGLNGGIHFGLAASGDNVFVPISDADESRHHAAREPNPGVFALDVKTGEYLWQWQAVTDACGEREYCQPGNGAAITATEELVMAGSLDGYLRIHDNATGEVLWAFDTARDFTAVNGVTTRGGALEGGASAVMDGGMLFLNSGYFFNPYMPGNAFLAFEVVEGENDDE